MHHTIAANSIMRAMETRWRENKTFSKSLECLWVAPKISSAKFNFNHLMGLILFRVAEASDDALLCKLEKISKNSIPPSRFGSQLLQIKVESGANDRSSVNSKNMFFKS